MQNNTTNTNSSETLELKYAGFGIRFFAYLIDNFILGAGLLIIKFSFFILKTFVGLEIFSNQILFQYSWADIVIYLCRALYFVLLTYFTGATIGKHILKLRVISTNETGKYTFMDILYRETIGRYLSKVIIYAGYFLIFINKDKSALHDMLADTKVVYKNIESKEKVNNKYNNSNNISYDYIQIDDKDDNEVISDNEVAEINL